MLGLIIDELKNRGVADKNIFLVSFESSEYNMIKNDEELTRQIHLLTDNVEGKKYLLFDEIQHVNDWERSINSFRVDMDCDIYVTGSNSELLSGKLSTLIAGRYMEIRMYPFSFNEVLQFFREDKKEEINSLRERELFDEYLEYGGLPFTLNLGRNEKTRYIHDIYNSILMRDIINNHNIRNIDMLERLLLYMIENIGCFSSANSVSKYLKSEGRKLSVESIVNYLNYFTEAFLFTRVPREDLAGKKLLTINEKYYLADTGFYSAFINKSNRGRLLENVVFNELIRRGFTVSIGKVNNLEVDFVCRKDNKKMYIQVSETVMDENTREREFRPLMKINDFYPKYVLTMDTWDYSRDGIVNMNITDFLKSDVL